MAAVLIVVLVVESGVDLEFDRCYLMNRVVGRCAWNTGGYWLDTMGRYINE